LVGYWASPGGGALELIKNTSKRATIINGDAREPVYLFQQLSMALHRENKVSFQSMFKTSQSVANQHFCKCSFS